MSYPWAASIKSESHIIFVEYPTFSPLFGNLNPFTAPKWFTLPPVGTPTKCPPISLIITLLIIAEENVRSPIKPYISEPFLSA